MAKNRRGTSFTNRDNEQRTNVRNLDSLYFGVTAARSTAGDKTMYSLTKIAIVAGLVLFSQLMRASRPEKSPCQATALVNRDAHGKWEAKLAQAYCAVETELATLMAKLTKLTNMRKTPGISLFCSLRE